MIMYTEEKNFKRTEELFNENRNKIYAQTDRLFVGLMLFQWLFAIILSLAVSPKTWVGETSSIHIHVWTAIFLGGLLAFFPIVLGIFYPAKPITRYTIAVSQMLYSALLIHLTGGRIETHFHVFGSLAFLAFYRDWKVLVPATIVVALDHWIRGVFWPQSVFGIITSSPYRWIEHAAWVLFEDAFLMLSCHRSVQEMRKIAERTVELEGKNDMLANREKDLMELNQSLDNRVQERTKKLLKANTDLFNAHEELKNTQFQLVQSEKLASIGQLAAGVAHEINNPVGFIHSNIQTLEKYIEKYTQTLRMMEILKQNIKEKNLDRAQLTVEELARIEEKNNFNFIMSDMDNLIQESKRGVARVKKIVMDLRTFAREDKEAKELIKVEDIIEGILNIVHNELKYKADLKKNYDHTPAIYCYGQKLGQVFINLLINAAQAIKDKGTIEIKTYVSDMYVCVEIKDSGQGIAPDKISCIFEPFFTTKPIGQGTGLGLSISYDIIKKHQGEIKVQSEIAKGTTFTVMLPLAGGQHV